MGEETGKWTALGQAQGLRSQWLGAWEAGQPEALGRVQLQKAVTLLMEQVDFVQFEG